MLKIHGVPISVHTRKVIVTAIEKQLNYRNEPVIPFNPPAGWDKLSPTGKIPVVEDDGIVLRDSSAICAYLERVHPGQALYPLPAVDYAQALWFEEYADSTVFPLVVHGLFFQKVIRPNILKQLTEAGVVDKIIAEALPKVFGYLNSAMKGDFLAGGKFSIADIALTSNLINFHYLGYQIDSGAYPRLALHFRRQLKRPSIEKALAAEQPIAASMGLDTAFVHYLGLAAA